MKTINLKRLLKNDAIKEILTEMVRVAPGLGIFNVNGTLLWGKGEGNVTATISLDNEKFGEVKALRNADCVASFLSYTAVQESEKRTLASETLERYKEITLLYNLTEKFSSSLNVRKLSGLILEETLKNLNGDSASIMIYAPETGRLKKIAAIGENAPAPHVALKPSVGIAGSIYKSGQAEIINDVSSDVRYLPGTNITSSMMCAPLKAKDKTFGVINISSHSPLVYTSSHLKLFNAITSQAAYAIENANLHVNTLREERIKSNLRRYISSKLVDAIINSQGNISLEPKRMDITILFSDIRNFTNKCENLAAEKIVGYLNDYFSYMVDVIFAHKGTINKFVGDMIVALFGVPSVLKNSTHQAVLAAIEMQRTLRTLPNKWIKDNFPTGIGINSGEAIVGNIGSSYHMDYTAIGDEVNIAARLQSIAKGGQILVSGSVYNKTKQDFNYRSIGCENVKGKTECIDVYEVLYD